MKTKSIVLSAIAGLAILTGAGALTFASTNQFGSGTKQGHMRMGGFNGVRSGMNEKFKGNGIGMGGGLEGIKDLSDTDRQAMMDAVQKAIEAKDYNAFKDAHTKYGITVNMTEDQFNTMLTKRTEMDQERTERQANRTKIQEAIKNGDYKTWKSLNKDMPILNNIDTQEKFKKLQEMEKYRTKMDSISEELGLHRGEGMGFGMGRNAK